MRRIAIGLIAALCIFSLTTTAQAGPITYDYAGIFIQARNQDTLVSQPCFGLVCNGDAFSGSFTYNNPATPLPGGFGGSNGVTFLGFNNVTDFSLTIGGTTLTSSTGSTLVLALGNFNNFFHLNFDHTMTNTEVLRGRGNITSLTSVPEPSTLLLLGAGLAMVGIERRRQKK